MDVEVDNANRNLRGHTINVLFPTGLCGGISIAVDLLTNETVWSGEKMHAAQEVGWPL